ncbi:MAG: hypothetical protein J5631_15050 [Spirochaetaceae bacterium]|nr:hypothetical protein [Spirochaetaceae bacterium]
MTINSKNASQIAKYLDIEYTELTPVFERIPNADNTTRLRNALKSLPLPAAFSDSKIALRKIRKENDSQTDIELKMIYKLAVWESFCIEPYSETAQCPSFNILEKAFKEVKTLSYDWNSIGYKYLKLNSSDIKAMISFWGEPSKHSTLHEKYNELYKSYERKVANN